MDVALIWKLQCRWISRLFLVGSINLCVLTFSEPLYFKLHFYSDYSWKIFENFSLKKLVTQTNWFSNFFSWVPNPFRAFSVISSFLSDSSNALSIMTSFLAITSAVGAINVRSNLLLRNRLNAVNIRNYLSPVSLSQSLKSLNNLSKVAAKLPV